MARPWLRRIGRIAVVITVVTAVLVLPWALAWPWLRNLLAGQWPTWIVIAVAIDAALLLLAAIWWLWWRLPERQVARLTLWETKARADVEDNFRKTVGQALGGAAVLIGAVAAYLQFTQQQQAIRGQLQSAHDLLISNQVAKGFEQLSRDSRLGQRNDRPLAVQVIDSLMNGAIECGGAGECLMSQVVRLQVVPDDLDVV